MSSPRLPRPTKVESAIGAVLLAESVLELFDDDPYAQPAAVRVAVALVPPVVVAFSRRAPRGAAAVVLAAWFLDIVLGPPLGTLGAGFSMLVVAFGLSAWRDRPWGWLGALLVLDAVRMSRMTDAQPEDVYIDAAFIALVVLVGRVVRRRTVQAEFLGSRLELSERARETAAQEAVQRERAVLARELHDIVAHSVSLMVVQAGTARPRAHRLDAELASVLETVERSGREALVELRRLLGVLRADEEPAHEPMPDLDGLPALVDGVRQAGLAIDLDVAVQHDVPAGVALCAYRAVQEGLTNALRHAPGSTVRVAVAEDGRLLRVEVRDRGGAATTSGLGSGNGLLGLRERVLLCGGRMSAAAEGDGFALRVELPLDEVALVEARP
jgi:signal transduction histidine kinase